MFKITDNRDARETMFYDIKIGDFFEDAYGNIYVKTRMNSNVDNIDSNSFCFSKAKNEKMFDTDCFKLLDVDMKISYTKGDN